MECLTCKNKIPGLKDLCQILQKKIYYCDDMESTEDYIKFGNNNIEPIDNDIESDESGESQRDYWMSLGHDIKSGYATNLENGNNHFAYVCMNCSSVHIYCSICKNWVKLVERSVCMEGYNHCTLVSWRDELGKYHSTSVESIFTQKCQEFVDSIISQINNYSKESIVNYLCRNYCEIDKKCYVKLEKKYKNIIDEMFKSKYGKTPNDLYEELFDEIVNNFNDTHSFKLDDLNIYCLDPNDLRLVTKQEQGLASYGIGFNIEEQSWLKWECVHAKTTIEGHDD